MRGKLEMVLVLILVDNRVFGGHFLRHFRGLHGSLFMIDRTGPIF